MREIKNVEIKGLIKKYKEFTTLENMLPVGCCGQVSNDVFKQFFNILYNSQELRYKIKNDKALEKGCYIKSSNDILII